MNKRLVEIARDLLVVYVHQHQKECTKRRDDCLEVAGILAYIAHSIGATREDLDKLPGLLFQMDMECESDSDCIHTGKDKR